VGHKNRQGGQVVHYQHGSQIPLTISVFQGVKSRNLCIRICEITKSEVPMKWGVVENSEFVSTLEVR
jgi:hypothetical protein